MRTLSLSHCDLCGASGEVLHAQVGDHTGGVPGVFSILRCTNPACGTLWLEPRPIPEDLHLAYQQYYTHTTYQASPGRSWKRAALNLWTGLFGVHAERDAMENMLLANERPGKVLDVGCGNGVRLHRLRKIGWEPQGQEVDSTSAAVAERDLGIPVYVGTLDSAPFPEASFDAVISNHVLEHVYEPEMLLRDAWRFVKPGGILVFIMPNASAYLHRVYGDDWKGLDPPRHLRLFTPLSLIALAHRAGMEKPVVTTSAARAEIFVRGSMEFARTRGVTDRTLAGYWFLHSTIYYATAALIHYRLDPLRGEELILRARNPLQ